MSSGLAAGFLLDQQWHWMRGEMETTKKPALAALVRVLDSANVSYAIIRAGDDRRPFVVPSDREATAYCLVAAPAK